MKISHFSIQTSNPDGRSLFLLDDERADTDVGLVRHVGTETTCGRLGRRVGQVDRVAQLL